MSVVGFSHYFFLGLILFSIGALGALTRRNGITIFLSIELMLNSVNLILVSYASTNGNLAGQILVFFMFAIAAAEAAVGLAFFIAIYKHRRTINIDRLTFLRW